jgi:hypothetical protein
MDYKFRRVGIVSTIALAAVFSASRAQADEWNKKTVLTINQPIQISEAYLEPGTYVMKLVDSPSDRHIVRVMDASETHVIETVLAIPNYRIRPTDTSRFQFWETPAGYAPALRAWFYPGDDFGQEFKRPKQLRQIAMVTKTTATPAVTAERNEVVETAPAVEEPAPAPAPPVVEESPAPAPQPVAEEPAPAPAPQQPAPAVNGTQLPKTATYAPVMGFSGLVAFGLYSLLRLRRA